jgi:two-component system nitrate/nitrite response regulator NarL
MRRHRQDGFERNTLVIPVIPSRALEPEIPHDPYLAKKSIRVVIADDQTIFRESLEILLHMTSDIEVCGKAQDGQAAMEMIRELKPDILVHELKLPILDGMDILRELQNGQEAVRSIVLCGSISKEDTVRAVRLGAKGIVLKSEPTDSLLECIRKVTLGEYCIGNRGMACLLEAVTDQEGRKEKQKSKFGLTSREHEIVVAVLEGYSNPEIADKFGLSEQTIKHHLSHIFDKLGVYSRLELALFAVNHHILQEG